MNLPDGIRIITLRLSLDVSRKQKHLFQQALNQ